MTRLTEVELAELNRAKTLAQPMNVQQVVEQAHRLRAQATADMFGKAARGIVRMLHLKQLGAHVARQALYARTYRELSQLNDRSLADIGMTRSEIDSVARELSQTGTQDLHAETQSYLSGLRTKLAKARLRRETRRRIAELDDRMLMDIGINPQDNLDVALDRIMRDRKARRTAAQDGTPANSGKRIVGEKLRKEWNRPMKPAANQPVEDAQAA